MKHIYNRAASVVLMVLCTMGIMLTACGDGDLQEVQTANTVVKVKIASRSQASTWWNTNDAVTLQAYKTDAETPTQTAVYTLGDANTWSTTGGLYWDSYQASGALHFMGYYPGTATANGLDFAIPTDQSDATKLHAADYMTTDKQYGVSNATTTLVQFTFTHRLARIVLNITYGEEYGSNLPTLTNAGITSHGSGVTVTPNADNSTASTVATTGTPMQVSPYAVVDAYGHVTSYTALVAPCADGNGNILQMSLAVDGTVRLVNYTGSITVLESGKAYNFNLKVEKDKTTITLGSANGLTDWGSADNEEDL